MFKKLLTIIRKALGVSEKRPARPAASKSSRSERGTRKSSTKAAPLRNDRKKLPKPVSVPAKKDLPKEPKPKAQKLPPPPMPELVEPPVAEGKTRFCDLDLSAEVVAGTQTLGFQYCTVIQEKCLPYAIAGRDLAAKAQTGTGKTAAFLAAAMTRLLRNPKQNRRHKTCRVLILEPTRELAMQIEKDADDLGKYTGLNTKAIFGGIDYKEQRDSLEEPVDILAGTPGRIIDYSNGRFLDLSETEILIIDEADRMLDMGFIPDVRRIVSRLPQTGNRQTMLFSATLDPEILRLVQNWLQNPVSVEAEPEKIVTDLIEQKFYAVTEDQKLAFLIWLIKNEPLERMIIFGNWKHKNAALAANLTEYGVPCEQLSGDIPQAKRIRILDKFKSGACKIVVATDVAARGIHVDDITHVVNYDLPEQAEDYVHRIGRTGRAGKKGKAISFVCEYGAYALPAIEEYAGIHAVTTQPEEECLILPPEKVCHVARERRPSSSSRGGRSSGHGGRSSSRGSFRH